MKPALDCVQFPALVTEPAFAGTDDQHRGTNHGKHKHGKCAQQYDDREAAFPICLTVGVTVQGGNSALRDSP